MLSRHRGEDYVILCSSWERPPADLAGQLGLENWSRSPDHEQAIWICRRDFPQVERAIAEALATRLITSVALLRAAPTPDRHWVIWEWAGTLVVDGTLADLPDSRLWIQSGSPQQVGLMIYRPASTDRSADATGEPGPKAQPDRIIDDQVPRRVETAAEFRESLDSVRPVIVKVPADRVLAGLEDWFGEFADMRLGGAIAILALSGVESRTSSEVVIGNPVALGLQIDEASPSLASRIRSGVVSVKAWGTGGGKLKGQLRAGDVVINLESIAGQFAANREHVDAPYGLVMHMTAEVDPDVLIDTGLVFEQERLNGVQTLATGSSTTARVDLGKPAAVALPAWCLNRTLSAPNGQMVRPTPLRFPLAARTTQAAVWKAANQAKAGLGAGI